MSAREIEALVKVGACDSLGVESVPALTLLLGEMGEVVGAVYSSKLNRKQMTWLLPSLLSLRHLRGRGMFRRARASMETEANSQSTGTYGNAISNPMQTMMGAVMLGWAFSLSAPSTALRLRHKMLYLGKHNFTGNTTKSSDSEDIRLISEPKYPNK